jgi:putative ABC transport system permease protein
MAPRLGFSMIVRARNGVDLPRIKSALEAIDSRLTMLNMQTVREHLSRMDREIQYVTGIYSAIGVFALILASVGLAGVTAQDVSRRRKEIGIRMALGARRRQWRWVRAAVRCCA